MMVGGQKACLLPRREMVSQCCEVALPCCGIVAPFARVSHLRGVSKGLALFLRLTGGEREGFCRPCAYRQNILRL